MKQSIILLLICIIVVSFAQLKENYEGCTGEPNLGAIIDQPPSFISETKGGKRFLIQEGKKQLHIVVVQGSAYEMGYAYGQLMKKEIKQNLNNFWEYIINEVKKKINQRFPGFGVFPIDILAKKLAFQLLKQAQKWTEQYTPSRIEEELKGIAAGSGEDFQELKLTNLVPEVIKAACSIVGAWGPATKDGNLYQLRALDWDHNAPINQFPTIVVYKPTEAGSNTYANIGYAGLISMLTGFSPKLGISEKVWRSEHLKFDDRKGEPWAYVLKKVMQFGNDLNSAIDILTKSKRTCKIFVGVGSRSDNQFRGATYDYENLNAYDDKNCTMCEYGESHPQIDGVVFWDKGWQPSNNKCVGGILSSRSNGQIDAEVLYREVTGRHKTGDSQIAVFDFQRQIAYISYSEYGTGVPAYLRRLFKVDMNYFFNINP